MHYALVSDLLTKEEFDERVEKKCEELGGAVDEICAAMLVVEELGRSHIKIGEIKDTATALVSFFGKILEITPPREFRREGAEDAEPGVVASVVLGDPTGTVRMTLWDAMAAAVSELELGSVLEVIAKPRPGYRNEVTCMALRPSQVTIVETKKPPRSETMKIPLA
ncbi:MAG TPA: OB-fold nucleic acid binding domain-containing protein, partial [Methanocorpusculum sp.]|nr:OB-fold nucleic acid binding domain-containing protein [Methanocorpusculum sp.]